MTSLASNTSPSGEPRAVTSDSAPLQNPTFDQMREVVIDVHGQIIMLMGCLEALLEHTDHALGFGSDPTEPHRVQAAANFQCLFESVMDARVRPLYRRAEDLDRCALQLSALARDGQP